MKKRFYLVRHGDKVKHIGDPPISENGVIQAKATGKYFKKIPIKKILSSPILRAKQTAQHISDMLTLDFAKEVLLKERVNWGDGEPSDFEDFLVWWEKASEERDWVPPIGDSSRKAGERLQKLISSYAGDDDQILLVTHGGVITDFLRNVFNEEILDAKVTDFSKLRDKSIHECSVTVVDYDSTTSTYELIELASTNHLQR